MRASEWVQIGFSCGMAVLAWVRPLDRRRRIRIALLACAVAGAILSARFVLHGYVSSIVRDWLPAVLLLFPYWQAGQFFTQPDKRIEALLGRIDERVMQWLAGTGWRAGRRGWAAYFHYGNSVSVMNRMNYQSQNRFRRWLWRKQGCRHALWKHYPNAKLHQQYGLYELPATANWQAD